VHRDVGQDLPVEADVGELQRADELAMILPAYELLDGFSAFTLWQHSHATPDTMASSVPSPEGSDPYADRRVYPRVPVALPAFLQANGDRHAVQILDLSPGGAKLDCPASLPTGTTVILDCGTLGRAAVVRWNSAGVAGICFDSELDTRDVSALIERSEALDARMKTRE
jgi:hypothetical protein